MLVSWNVTKKCNLYCEHCYRDSGPTSSVEDQLTTEEGIRLIDQIKQAGFKLLIFSGGEPLIREDLCELIAYASSIGLRPALGSNGTLLTAAKAAELKKAGLGGIAISIDSATPEYHNRFRNAPEGWQQALEGIRYAQKAGLRVQINMTLTEGNMDDFGQVAQLAEELHVSSLHPFFLVPTGRAVHIEEDGLKRERYYSVLRSVLSKQKSTSLEIKPTCAPQFMPLAKSMGLEMRYTRGCLAGISYCSVLPSGEVHICPYLPVKVGNVREQPFDEIWRDNPVFRDLRDFKKYEGECGSCPDVGICGGCRARSYYYSGGNFMAEEPWCYKRSAAL
ncbi:radical SAM protein [Paenibacillus sp. CMAA1739]|uniref:radical SAM/SPASM domain-containing protein n=1 Tax=Paenibacillus ottowii TaxID=2315729 RepID=UPI0027308E78|nr:MULTISPECIES: radical SAM protein [Paenibacillus]MDP1512303.1 radical SAM protein [Paenibacillus ottowii]MEC4568273.1 radical SAM protein [Paenibacillus sp. CMAA1739]